MRLTIRTLLFLVLAVGISSSPQANAQERPKSLLELLFPRAKEEPKQKPAAKPKPKPKLKVQKQRVRNAPKASATTQNLAPAALIATPAIPALPPEKLPDAKKILVVGDFLGSGLAAGLTATFEQDPRVVVVDAANGSSGLVRDDFYNWPNEIGGLITVNQPSIVVVMIGANDRQPLLVSGKREEVRSPLWLADYRTRVRALANTVTSRNIPLVWVGQLPFRSSSLTADMLALNDIFREAADNERAQSSYIDVWEGFVDEAGKFVERGPDIDGQTVTLRTGQVNVTKAGYRKIAFYAENTLNRLLGDSTAPQIGTLGESNLPPLSLGSPELEANLEQMRPIDLLNVTSNSSDELMGANVKPLSSKVQLENPPAPAGRIDNLQIRP